MSLMTELIYTDMFMAIYFYLLSAEYASLLHAALHGTASIYALSLLLRFVQRRMFQPRLHIAPFTHFAL